ncbi:alpha-L-fucosidase [Chitinophaga agrisoli]|uniref:alpha-L-fucosidase n=1 Tax=Chitinophaga agrisoli TaxID=2607653 RepID=A0A5B2VQU1_9BACT|nr:alpha-L-fucosidase [Chitinophaga agrisoli]KAA2241405.1 alpha-L-fucosidase [Chitinophaga agrisoli]
MKRITLVCFLVLFTLPSLFAQQYEPNWASLNTREIPAWFHQSKFGIFIHWGVYAVPSYAVVSPGGYSEWYWYNLMTPGAQTHPQVQAFHDKNFGKDFPYAKFEPQFTAALFDPAQWADIFRRSGAKYVVLTSKHHEGYCLWNSPWADKAWGRPWNAVTGTPKRDLLGDLTNAVRNAGLRMGYYYSLYEWFNPLWLSNKQQYIKEVMEPEFKDLVTRYKPAVIFSDGEWELSDTAWNSPALLAWLYNQSPVKGDVVVNDRWGSNTRGHNAASTYLTSEYGSGMAPDVVWEESRGIGQSYGYNRMENVNDYKSSHDLLLALVDIVSRGGNLLLDIGPTADGRIPVIMQQRLVDMGDWLKVNGEAIYETSAWQRTRQWSTGKQPTVKQAAFMADYDVVKMVQPSKEHANIEMFFTKKDNNLYCIVPAYHSQLIIKDYTAPAGAKVVLLGSKANIRLKQQGKDCLLDLSALHPGDISHPLFVIKITAS